MTQTPRVRIGSPALPNSSESRALPSPSPQLLFPPGGLGSRKVRRRVWRFAALHRPGFFGQDVLNAPSDHCYPYRVIDAEARDHGIDKYREYLPPRQWFESRKTHERQDASGECIHPKGK